LLVATLKGSAGLELRDAADLPAAQQLAGDVVLVFMNGSS
jgi:hypothetical protein